MLLKFTRGRPPPPVIATLAAHAEKLVADISWSPARARNSGTAVRRLANQLADNEPMDDVVYFRDHLDELGRRLRGGYGHGEDPASGQTIQVYVKRARDLTGEYLRHTGDPVVLPPVRDPQEKLSDSVSKWLTQKPGETLENKRLISGSNAMLTYLQRLAHNAPSETRTCVLRGGGRVTYNVPRSGINTEDACRVALQLLALADDYDPTAEPFQVLNRWMMEKVKK